MNLESTTRRVAIFDVDGTIFPSSLTIELVEELIENGSFPKEAQKEFESQHQKWLDREGDYESYINAVVEAFRKHLKGVSYAELSEAGERAVEMHAKQTYRYTRDLLKDLKARGYYLLAVSHSPK